MYDIVGKRNWYFAFSALITIPGLIFIAARWSEAVGRLHRRHGVAGSLCRYAQRRGCAGCPGRARPSGGDRPRCRWRLPRDTHEPDRPAAGCDADPQRLAGAHADAAPRQESRPRRAQAPLPAHRRRQSRAARRRPRRAPAPLPARPLRR